jgi:hypothetical protein
VNPLPLTDVILVAALCDALQTRNPLVPTILLTLAFVNEFLRMAVAAGAKAAAQGPRQDTGLPKYTENQEPPRGPQGEY